VHVVIQTQANNLNYHLDEEDPRKEVIETREHSLLLQRLRVVIDREHDGIRQDENEDDEVVDGVIDERIDLPVDKFCF